MPRMWMVPPAQLCQQHLIAEHHETHVFAGKLKAGHKVDGYASNNLLEPLSFVAPHNALVEEMVARGYNHGTPIHLKPWHFVYLPDEVRERKVNVSQAQAALHERCEKCHSLHLAAK